MFRLILMFALLIMTVGSVMAEQDDKVTLGKVSPHGEKGSCAVCHVVLESDLRSFFTLGSTKRKLRNDYNALCLQCHDIVLGHGVGKRPKNNRERLLLDGDGKIACAITCHNMHVRSDDQKQTKFHLRTSVNRLCLSCHDN